jgi:hypothetical protein
VQRRLPGIVLALALWGALLAGTATPPLRAQEASPPPAGQAEAKSGTAGEAAGEAAIQAAAGPAGETGGFEQPSALEWKVVFKLVNLTAHGEEGDAGFVREGDDTQESNEQTLRLQLTGQPLLWLDYRLDYLNVKQHLAGTPPPERPVAAALFRRRTWRRDIEALETDPGQAPSTQTVRWYHEIDHALLRMAGGAFEATVGRQPITWGAGRVWQPTDLFVAFDPLALDKDFKPGVDGLLVGAYPFDHASLSLAYVLTSGEQPDVPDSAVLRWRSTLGAVSELTLLGGRLRDESVAGGTLETAWLDAGWRVEGVAFQPRGGGDAYSFGIAGVDYQLPDGTIVVLEVYRHSLGAGEEDDLLRVASQPARIEGRMPHLSRTVLALAAERDFAGLWHWGYLALGSSLRNAAGERHASVLHQLSFNYSLGENATAVFALSGASGPGEAVPGVPRSEFGHLPDALHVSLQFVL